jgi:hypothetical protein
VTLALFPSDTRQPRAVFSPCVHLDHDDACPEHCEDRRYRYFLEWPAGGKAGSVLWVLANPSTADASKTDPTIAKCIRFATRWGLAWSRTVNVRAWRATDPRDVPADPLAIGPENDEWIARAVREAELVVCGWGKLGGARGLDVLRVIRAAGKAPHALVLNKDGSPSHPLYIREDTRPVVMT